MHKVSTECGGLVRQIGVREPRIGARLGDYAVNSEHDSGALERVGTWLQVGRRGGWLEVGNNVWWIESNHGRIP